MRFPAKPNQVPKPTQKRPFYTQWWFIVLVVLFFVVVIGSGIASERGQSGPQSTPTASPTTSAESSAVTIPDVVGMKGDAAKDVLTAAGITGLVTLEDETGEEGVWDASNWTVTSQDPAAGTQVSPADAVVLKVHHDSEDASSGTSITSDLAQRTHDEYLNAWGVDDLSELAGDPAVTVAAPAITEWEDVSAGTIRVYVQENLSDDRAHELGRNILSLTGLQVTDLDTVVVRGADGVDVNVYSTEVPLLSQR